MDRRYYRSSELSVMFQIVDVRNVSRAGMKGAIARAVFCFLQMERPRQRQMNRVFLILDSLI